MTTTSQIDILRHWTVAELEEVTLPADTDAELLEGVLTMTTRPHWQHQHVVAQLVWMLQTWVQQGGGGIVLPEAGWIISADTAVTPDVVWVRRERVAAVLHSDGKLHAAPDLVVEVVSAGSEGRHRDREEKRRAYARAGVAEYWIVDRFVLCIEVYRQDAAGDLALHRTLHPADTLTSPLLPNFAADVAAVFAAV